VSGAASSTIGDEKRSNPALALGADDYVTALVAGLDAYPANYAHMAAANAAGPQAPDLAPPVRAGARELARRIAAGQWVVDLRHRRAFAARHVPGSLSFEYGDSFATYLGWLIPWGAPLSLIGETGAQIAAAQRDLARIGIDRLAGAAISCSGSGRASSRLATYPVSDYPGLAAAWDRQDFAFLDVRRASERADGFITGSVHAPLHELPARLRDLPQRPLWVHCRGGYRASIAAPLLQAAGTPSPSSTTTSAVRWMRASPSPGRPGPRPPRWH
jgi:hydroxyacylglutathione hydrolase